MGDDKPAVGAVGFEEAYEELPYLSMPVVFSQPARLAAMAQLHGHRAAPAETARVLELGCAGGGNIVPLAARFPSATFLGIDIAPRHVRDARQRIAELGLRNIEVRQGDIARLDLGDATFDYIVCHGVFSWVPVHVREALLRLCGRHLGAAGVATISYNVLPGWHLRQIVRDACLAVAGDGPVHDRVARARSLLGQIAKGAIEPGPYGTLMAAEARRLVRLPASYIAGEFLAEHNHPTSFAAFAGQAGLHGLRYLCESDLPSSGIATMAPKAAAAIGELGAGDHLRAQHLVDIFSGRPFRRSLLVRADAGSNSGTTAVDRLDGLHVAGVFTPTAASRGGEAMQFDDHRGRPVMARSARVARMLRLLGSRYPSTVACTQLLDGPASGRMRTAGNLLKLLESGRASIASVPLLVGDPGQERPCAWELARREAAARQPWVTSLQHMPVLVPPRVAFLLRHMDGNTDRQRLAALLVDGFERSTSLPPTDPVAALARAVVEVDEAVRHLARRAILLPAT